MWFILFAAIVAIVIYKVSKKQDTKAQKNAVKKSQIEQIRPVEAIQEPTQPTSHVIQRLKTPAALLPPIDSETFDSELSAIPPAPIVLSEKPVTRHMLKNMGEVKFSNITRKTNMQKLFPLVVIDTETTGLGPSSDDIIELSAIKYEFGFKPVSCFYCLLKPRKKIPPKATQINNITDEMVSSCPPFQKVCASFSEYISGCNIVGHNLLFDLEFLYTGGMDIPEKVRYYDSMKIAKHTLISYSKRVFDPNEGRYLSALESGIHVDDFKLVTLCEYYNIHRGSAHRALSDCHATAKVFERLISDKTQPIE